MKFSTTVLLFVCFKEEQGKKKMLRRHLLSSSSNISLINSESTTFGGCRCVVTSLAALLSPTKAFSLPGQQSKTGNSVKNFSPAERREQMRIQQEERQREIKRKVDDYKRKYHPNARETFFGILAVSAIFFSLFIGGGCMLPKSTGFFEDPGDRESSY